MNKKGLKNIKKCLVSSFLALLMLASCTENASKNNSYQTGENDNLNENFERVDFDKVLRNLTKGFDEIYNDSVKVTSAIPDAKLRNQEITVIIELDKETALEEYFDSGFDTYSNYYKSKQGIEYENQLVKDQSSIAAKLLKNRLIDQVYGNYDTVLNGIYAKTTYGRMEQIRQFDGVKAAYVSTQYYQPTAVKNETNVDEVTGIYENETKYDGSNTIVAVLDSGFDYSHEVFQMDIENPAKERKDIEAELKDTVAYELSNGDLTINDVYISPKIPFAYDYAEKKADVFPVESDHGTHVSGIIGGESQVIKGIAPQTQFAWLKVFSDDDGGGDSGDILCALEDAIKLEVDAINMSLGAVGGYSVEVPYGEQTELLEKTNEVYGNIEKAGISLITAAGNEYSSGYQSATGTNLVTNPESGTVSSPGSYPGSLTVASIDGVLTSYAQINNEDDNAIFFKNAFDSKQVEHEFVDELIAKLESYSDADLNSMGITKNADGSYDVGFVVVPGYGDNSHYISIRNKIKNKIAIVKRGTSSFEDKLKMAFLNGAFACVIYNNVSGTLSITVGDEVPIPVALITQEAGTRLENLKEGTLTFNKDEFKAGPFMSDFSSWGPLTDLTLKPEITAHGGFITSSILGGGYDEMSGTSMATPNACGIVLVIRDYVKETWKQLDAPEVTKMVNRLLMSSATICLNEVGNPYSPRKQGAGLASLSNSVNTNAYLYIDDSIQPEGKTKIELGDDPTKSGKYTLEFNISNISSVRGEAKTLTYNVGNLTMTETVSTDDNPIKSVAETAYMLDPNMDVKVENISGNATLNGTELIVPSGTVAKITVTLTLTDADKKYIDDNFKNGMYVEGFATLDANEGEVDLNVPFLAYYGDWLTPPMFDKTFYEVDADRANGSISEKDKTKADLYASTPYGKYGDYYMIPLGSYIYDVPAGFDLIPASEEKAAISLDEDCIYQLYTAYLGMLRGAKKLTTTITDDKTGKVIYTKVTYNNMKATYYGNAGQTLPFNSDFDFPMYDLNTGDPFANNSKMTVKMVAELDYENGANVANNTFEFSFYVDYETPTLENINYVTEWDQTEKENRYYIELTVSDNRFVQAIRPCVITNNTLISLTDYPTPVLQDEANQATTVRIEITDYLHDIKNSDYSNSIVFMINDYALNSNLFIVPLSGTDNKELAFKESRFDVNANEIINLNDYVNVENAVLQNMKWTATSSNVAVMADDGELIGILPEGAKNGNATVIGRSEEYGITINGRFRFNQNPNASINLNALERPKFDTYSTIFTFDDDFEYSSLGSVPNDDEIVTSILPSSNLFEIYPSESFKLHIALEPWYLDDSNVTIKWESSFPNKVKVEPDASDDRYGIVTALEEATGISIRATIQINGVDTIQSIETNVTVKSPFIISGIVLQYYKGPGGVVTIPDDKGIQYIGEYAFSHYIYHGFDEDGYAQRQYIGDNHEAGVDNPVVKTYSEPITKIIVPEGVEIIQNYAFAGLQQLEEVVLPNSINDIYVGAFYNDKSLQKINLNHVNKIENFAFTKCRSLTDINGEDAQTSTSRKKDEIDERETQDGNDLSNVITIGQSAFEETGISKIRLNCLRMAGRNAFANCNNLKDVTLFEENPISNGMFSGSAIEEISIPTKLINTNAFANCSSLRNVTFTNDEVTINARAFARCENLETITFADNCQNLIINESAFSNSKISNLVLPSGSVTLANNAFRNSSLNTLTLKSNTNITFIGTPFVGADEFNSIVIDGTSESYDLDNGMLVNKAKDTLILVPNNLVVSEIPANIKTIGFAAFAGNATTELEIPNTVNTIQSYAFAYSKLETVDIRAIANNVTLGEGVFDSAASLNQVYGLNSLTNIPNYMFASTALTDITLTDNVVIGESAFENCTSLTGVTLGNNVTIGNYAFARSFAENDEVKVTLGSVKADGFGEYAFASSNITSFESDNVDEIGAYAFAEAQNLVSVNAPKVTKVGDSAFRALAIYNDASQTYEYVTKLQTVILGNVSKVGSYAFFGNTALNSFTATSLNEIGDYAFANTSALQSIDLQTTQIIGTASFAYSGITAVDLENVTSLGTSAFQNCASLSNVMNLENSKIVKIPDSAFYAVDISIEYDQYNEPYYSAKYVGKLILINLSKIEEIGEGAFYGQNKLGQVDLSKVKKIGNYAFDNCTSLYGFDLSECLELGEGAFYSAGSSALLNTINMPKLEKVGDEAFYDANLKTLDLPDSLTDIGDRAFTMINGLTNFTYNGEVNYTKNDAENNPLWKISDGVLYKYLENGKWQLDAYPMASERTSYVIDDETYRVAEESFISAKNLTEVTFPYSLELIGDSAFLFADNLKNYTFKSYKAPVLEANYNDRAIYNIQTLYMNHQITQSLKDLYYAGIDYFITLGDAINGCPNMYFFLYPYHYANFVFDIGFIENYLEIDANDLTMNYPTNGVGYDSWIYKHYFASRNNTIVVADEVTSRVMQLLEDVFSYEHATSDNIDAIKNAYTEFNNITDEQQIALLDQEQVKHLQALYDEVVEMETPKVEEAVVKEITGIYDTTDADGNKYHLEIYNDGTGIFKVDNVLNDNLDVTYEFNEVRQTNDGQSLQIMVINQNTGKPLDNPIIFSYDKETQKISLRYYIEDLRFDYTSEAVKPITDEPFHMPVGGIIAIVVGSVVTVALLVAVVVVVLKKKKNYDK